MEISPGHDEVQCIKGVFKRGGVEPMHMYSNTALAPPFPVIMAERRGSNAWAASCLDVRGSAADEQLPTFGFQQRFPSQCSSMAC
eukprot:CAMPEP_0175575484 /NCGR_PEP_ID=MMETSP0096-20121207/44588_1 /TAXON_ID=311494 /ORGANISM="Alexandrium monilatum, Strain CCMP3105" /LENGTH=84 /DNA_ID=CAMNT_0016879013 /DNA_START=199 /DNA_END=454 /DNA_ORIENTATION=-